MIGVTEVFLGLGIIITASFNIDLLRLYKLAVKCILKKQDVHALYEVSKNHTCRYTKDNDVLQGGRPDNHDSDHSYLQVKIK
jgi:hypothetical protein